MSIPLAVPPDSLSLDPFLDRPALQQLLAEGLKPSTQPTEKDILSYRRLLQILFSSCISKPTQSTHEEAGLTITVINTRSEALPALLHRLPPLPEPQIPFYKWIIPRIIEATARYMSAENTHDLAHRMLGTSAHLMELLKREDPALGDLQTSLLAQNLQKFAQDLWDMTPRNLFGFQLLPTPFTILAAHLVAGRVANIYTPLSSLTRSLSSGAKTFLAISSLRPFFLATINKALRDTPQPRLLESAVIEICESEDIDIFLDIVKHASLTTRHVIWQALLQIDDLDDLDEIKVAHLLTPIEGLITRASIKSAIPQKTLDAWTRRAEQKNALFADQLKALSDQVTLGSRKRKRTPETLRMIQERLGPEVSEESLAADVIQYVKSSSESDSIAPILLDIIALLDDKSASSAFDLWSSVAAVTESRQIWPALDLLLQRYSAAVSHCVSRKGTWQILSRALNASDRQVRHAASRAVCRALLVDDGKGTLRVQVDTELRNMLAGGLPLQASAVALAGSLARHASGMDLCNMIELLVLQLGSPGSALRSLAFAELLDISEKHGKTPFALVHPFLNRISVAIVQNLRQRPDVFAEAISLLGQSRQNFLRTTLNHTMPALVVSQDVRVIETIASIVGDSVAAILFENLKDILTRVLMTPSDASLRFLVKMFLKGKDPNMVNDVSAESLIKSVHIPLAVDLIIEMGDDRTKEMAVKALTRAQAHVKVASSSNGFVEFLKPGMLGIMTHMNETLHDMHGKKTVDYKRKLIKSLGALFQRIGGFMASFSPQIMATLQSTLANQELRSEALDTLGSFVSTLKHADFGPFAGRTTGALIAIWAELSPLDKHKAIGIINEIADNSTHLASYIDDIVGLDGIEELRPAANKLARRLSPMRQLRLILDRASSQNAAIATTSLRELALFLGKSDRLVAQLAMGDAFDPMVPDLVRILMAAITKEGDDAPRLYACECLGIIGALDPDRFTPPIDPPPMTIANNFNDKDEAVDFALHLIRDVLVHAFRGTYDTKLQSHLAFSIQTLLAFCDFTPSILGTSTGINLKTRHRWQSLPKDQIEVLAPLLESRYAMGEVFYRKAEHPIYPSASGYREWVQNWTTDLIGRIMSTPTSSSVQKVFGSLRGVLRQQDVTVACHLLPHLVLHTLLSDDLGAREEIRLEIDAVLQDQVNPRGSVNKRTFGAQLVFDLMDHLSRYLRLQRGSTKPEKSSANVEKLVTSLETELMANAALQSKAYARSLRNFEQRIVQLRGENRTNNELQTYFERLHQIYADLDEPDGMEGVSTFVIAPSLEHQIREHESTGRWTSAQSCWEVRLQQSPDDVALHVGLLKCLQNLGHYDTLRTHIRGVLSRHPEWSSDLSSYTAESAWITGDWDKVEALGSAARPLGPVMLSLQRQEDMLPVFLEARRHIGASIVSKQYARVYDGVLKLHQLHDIELVYNSARAITSTIDSINTGVLKAKSAHDLIQLLDHRYQSTAPSFRIRESVLTVRRAALGLVNLDELNGEIGQAWIQSSRIARKAGYEQTAYTSALQASERDTPFAFVQHAKLLRGHDGAFKALSSLVNAINLRDNDDPKKQRRLAKAVLLEARWAQETDRFEQNEVIARFHQAINMGQNLESPHFHLGHYYDTISASLEAEDAAVYRYQTCHYYILALRHGVKYIYQTMPRMLTLWLDTGESSNLKNANIHRELARMTSTVDRARKDLPTWQFLTAFPQIVSRIGHSRKEIHTVLRKIMARVIERYPQQAMWPTVGVMQSRRPERKSACDWVLNRAQVNSPPVANMIREADRLSTALLKLADDKVDKREVSIATYFPYVKNAVPSKMIMPLQDALTCALPTSPDQVHTHNPFPQMAVEIQDIHDRIEIMPSLQKPKKLVFIGSDGKRYPFLCKPHDDLRKDARLMDFNSMINKLLKSASESRRRHLYIRTYAVMPLNEECGLLEWVSNTNAFKRILEKEYGRTNTKIYSAHLHNLLETSRKRGADNQIKVFKESILPIFSPSVFQNWFLQTWPEPSAWLASRMAYSRTLAVMSMIGHVLGLGDRHGENILFDGVTGDTVHVDLNCLFEKGKTFEIPERVPFRLTHNLVDALGVTGVEGVFRKAAEIAMRILRENSDSLMSVLEAFAHDPLVEWSARGGRTKSDKDIRSSADKNLQPIRVKLQGQSNGMVNSVPRQVDILIKEATSANNLALMYQGWASYL